ncbi:hypothetical protein ALC57_11022, partial [Trachymyrmex cornetzi]
EMETILSDNDTYMVVDRDPMTMMTSDLRCLLMRWKSKSFIDDSTYRSLRTTDGNTPRAYGLPKIHKPGNPLRIIVSSINSPLYQLSLFLHNVIHSSIPKIFSLVEDGFHLVDKLNGTFCEDRKGKLNFLDTIVIIEENRTLFDRYYKSTFSGRFLNFKRGKDRLDSLSHQDVYKISCENCEATYVGQTKRRLKTRLQEDIFDIRKKSGSPSVISNHRPVFIVGSYI